MSTPRSARIPSSIHDAKALIPGGGEIQVIGKIATDQQLKRPVHRRFFRSGRQPSLCPPIGMSEEKLPGISFIPEISIGLNTGKSPASLKIAGAAFDMTNLFVDSSPTCEIRRTE